MGNLTEKQEVSQKIKEFRAYLERLCYKEVDDEYFVIEGYELKKTFIDIFGEDEPDGDETK